MSAAGTGSVRALSSPVEARLARPRGPGAAYAALSLVLLALVAALAVTARQPAPPTIAEFAPQAVERITGSSGDAGGSAGGTAAEPLTHEDESLADGGSAAAIDVARVRRCVGDPPRQIEDPQSPPCVPYWTGDNGGATSFGVTRDEIRIADAVCGWGCAYSSYLTAFFNSRFEFYGRQIRLIPHAVNFDAGVNERAGARAVRDQVRGFASNAPCNNCRAYFDELARNGIVGVHYAPLLPEPSLAAHRPYLWSYPMATDRLFATAGNWYCARFAGRNAVHAGDPVLQISTRKLGIILTEAGVEGTSAEPLNAQLESCGGRTDVVIEGTNQTYDYGYYAAFMENAILQMKTSGVTSVVCLCNYFYVGLAMKAATNQGFLPEWLLTNYIFNEHSSWTRTYAAWTPEQTRNMMLVLASPMHRPRSDHPSIWAVQEVSDVPPPSTSMDQQVLDFEYQMLLLLASGIQLAGPNLTPETFERGLHLTRFANPAHPIKAGSVGFVDGDHSMTDDVAEIWWSNTARGPYPEDPPGAFCYVDHGARRRTGHFPTDDPFFAGACDSGIS